jgi:hypothetical protein
MSYYASAVRLAILVIAELSCQVLKSYIAS